MGYFWLKMTKKGEELVKDKQLSVEDIMSRLRINDKDIIDTIYSTYYDLLDKENKRRLELDNKAYNLIGIVGVCITLIFGLGGILIEKIKIPSYITILTILYLGAFMLGMVSLLFALLAARARSDFKTVNDEDIFAEKVIKSDILTYKRYLIAHYWQIYQNDFKINEEKGKSLKISFRMFFANIIFLFLVVSVITNYSLTQGGKKMSFYDSKEKPVATPKPTDGKIETANAKPAPKSMPKPTPKPSSGRPIIEGK
jgi:hypothetical protein